MGGRVEEHVEANLAREHMVPWGQPASIQTLLQVHGIATQGKDGGYQDPRVWYGLSSSFEINANAIVVTIMLLFVCSL